MKNGGKRERVREKLTDEKKGILIYKNNSLESPAQRKGKKELLKGKTGRKKKSLSFYFCDDNATKIDK